VPQLGERVRQTHRGAQRWTFGSVRRLRKEFALVHARLFFLQRRPFRVCERCIRRNKKCKHKEKFRSSENIPVIMKERRRCRSLGRRWPPGVCGARRRSSAWWMCPNGRLGPLNTVETRPLDDLPTDLEAVHVKHTENFGVPVH
jgi:hypothetical protein